MTNTIRHMRRRDGRDGMILIVVMSFLAGLMLLAGTLFIVLSANLSAADNNARATRSLNSADAAIDYLLASINSASNDISAPNVTAPAGYLFDPITNTTLLASGRAYMARVTGRSRGARTLVEVVLSKDKDPAIGLWGSDKVLLKSNLEVYGYDSVANPAPPPTYEEASLGSNGELAGSPGHTIDGEVYLGETSNGVPATYTAPAAGVPTTDLPMIDTDPLGLVGGPLGDEFTAVAAVNDNASAVGGTTNLAGVLTIEGNVTLTAGNYYVDEISIAAPEALTIDASAGPVKIYLTGPAELKPNCDLFVNPPVPSSFQIYSQSTDELKLFPRTDFIGVIYAPLATIRIQPNGNFQGVAWGSELEMFPGGAIYMDVESATLLLNQYKSYQVVGWKQLK